MVASGALPVDAPMPTVRDLAAELEVSKLTVHKAYQELQRLGVLRSKTRRGTVVAPIAEEEAGLDRLLAFLDSGPFPEFERICERTNVRSMASPVPNPKLFDAEEFLACSNVLRKPSNWPFYYPDDVRDSQLARAFARFARLYGQSVHPEDVVPVGGVHPHLSHLLPAIIGRGVKVAIQEPHSLNASSFYRSHGYEVIGVGTGDGGLELGSLERACREGAAALVAAPQFGFADGIQWTETNRRSVAEILRRAGVKLVERVSLAVLAFDGPALGPLSMELPEYLGFAEFSLQHSIAPGIPYSFLVVREPYRGTVARRAVRNGCVLQKPIRLSAREHLSQPGLSANIERTVRAYRSRRDSLLHALQESLPQGCSVVTPQGGFCASVGLPRAIDGERLFRKAVDMRIAVMPGRYLCADGRGDDKVVLSYSFLDPTALEAAGAVVGRLIKSLL